MAGRIMTITAVAFLIGALGFSAMSQSAKTEFRFSHKLHIVAIGVDCSDCHESASTATTANANLLPARTVCADCHEDSEIAEFGYTGLPAPDRELMFSHQCHLGMSGVDCATCHSNIARADSPPSGLPQMDA